ncbi:hypothetical protein BC332_14922 [Capsicum chinense]|nr:hypothetical protein BC332_14922 [Capsicum chinense]
MTTNIAESLNSISMDEREYPMLYIFNSIVRKFGKKFRKRYAFVDGKENKFVPYAERILRDNKSASDSLYVKIPCEYAMAALRAKYGDGEGKGYVTPSTTTIRQFIKLKVTSSHTRKQLTLSLRRLNGLCHRNR